MPARIYPPARERLLEVWAYTEEQWGEEQADAYVAELVAAVESAVIQRHRWRPVPDVALTGIYFIRHRHHFIFFRELAKSRLGVISVLHENMDLPSRLREDLEREG